MSRTKSNTPIKKAVADKASLKSSLTILVFVIFTQTLIIIIGLFFTNNLWNKYHEDDRITYVKLDPNGNWTVERSNRQMDDFYIATVDSTISRLLSKCLSNYPGTIQNDWAVCSAFLSDSKMKDFFENRYIPDNSNFDEYVSNQMSCFNCDFVRFVVRDLDHKNSIPTSFKDVYGQSVKIYETLVYGSFKSSSGDVKNVVVDLKWSFVSNASKRTFGEFLIENSLGIYFIDYIEVEDI